MEGLRSDPLFVAMSRPVMLAGAPFAFVVGNAIAVVELFLVFRTPWVLAVGALAHAVCWAVCLREPRLIDIWLMKVRRCPRVKNFGRWQCNSYRP